MDRKKFLKTLGTGALAGSAILSAASCKEEENHMHHEHVSSGELKLSPEDEALMKQRFFTEEEMALVTVLADLVIPADEHSGSASQAGVPELIEFMMKDQPVHQIPMRGGLRWMNVTCLKRYEKSFVECTQAQQTELLDQIAWPKKAKPEMSQGVAFFSLFRNFCASGFFSSKIGIDDLGYIGNRPNAWEGPPADYLKKLGLV